MKRIVFSCLCILCLGTLAINAGVPQVINLSEAIIYGPQGGPQEGTGGLPPCDYCFTATITDNVLNVYNRSDEEALVVVKDLATESTVLSTELVDELEQILPAGNYQVEIFPENYAPLQGFFEVEE